MSELRMAVVEFLLSLCVDVAPKQHPDTVALCISLSQYFRAVSKRLNDGRLCHEYAENTTKGSER